MLILAITAGFGLVQGWLVTWLNIPAIVVTLATFIGLQGMSLALRPQAAGTITGYISDATQWSLAGMPACFLAVLVIVVAFEFVLFHTGLGRRLRAVGSNPLGATRVGIRVNRQILLAFVLSGLLTGIAGLILAGQVGIGSPATGIDYTLMSITAVVLGGTENRGRARLGPLRLDGRGPGAVAVERVLLHQPGFRDPSDRPGGSHAGCRYLLQRRAARENRVEAVCDVQRSKGCPANLASVVDTWRDADLGAISRGGCLAPFGESGGYPASTGIPSSQRWNDTRQSGRQIGRLRAHRVRHVRAR